MTQLDGVTFTIVAKSGRSIPDMALCQVGQEMVGKGHSLNITKSAN